MNLLAGKFNSLKDKLSRAGAEAQEREARRKAEKSKLPYVDLVKSPIEDKALALIPEQEAKELRVAGFQVLANKLGLAVADPEDKRVKDLIKRLEIKGLQVQVFVASVRGLRHAWNSYKYIPKETKEITGRVEIKTENIKEFSEKLDTLPEVRHQLEKGVQTAQTSEMMEIILGGGLANRASDIHLEPIKQAGRLRYRIDGLLHDVSEKISPDLYSSLVMRIKLLSSLKINIKDEPQDGRFSIEFGNKTVEIRTSVIPSEYGETVVLRLLDPSSTAIKLEELGLRPDDLKIINEEISKPNGMIINTGPTGSGKTTTLYAFLNKVYSPEKKIITIEDPIEYHLKGISQTQVDPDAGYTFASGLRSILRQDPDIILVGEIRDSETAGIAINAALTGHIVFTTLHTNDAVGAVPRLIDLGVKTAVLAPALSLVIAQRLVRKICRECLEELKLDESLKRKIFKFVSGLPDRIDKEGVMKNIRIAKPKGCGKCGGLGYKGRVGVFELFRATKEMEELIYQEPTELDLGKEAERQGMVTMQQDGLIKALAGLTTFDEVERATGPLDW